MKGISLGLVVFLALTLVQGAAAQTISQPTDNGPSLGTGAGQSFVATLDGHITTIGFRSATAAGVRTLHIYAGGSGSGTAMAVGVPEYSQPGVALVAVASGGPMQRVTLTTPFPVTAGQTYTFLIDGQTGLRQSNANPYAGGTRVFNYALPSPAIDLAFEIFEVPLAVGPGITAVPTLSQWGLGILVLVLAVSGGFMRRKTR